MTLRYSIFIAILIFLSLLSIGHKVNVTPPSKPVTQEIDTTTATFPLAKPTLSVGSPTSTSVGATIKKTASLKVTLPVSQPHVSIAPVIPTSPSVPEPLPDFEAINKSAQGAIVNIYCTAEGSPISGTGVIISPDGIILTNAHVGQFFLLQNHNYPGYIQCVVRTGSPAYPRYTAELVYISPNWVEENKALLKASAQTGTGENDFAFLRITGRTDGSTPPSSFPYIPAGTREVFQKGENVVLISYPAGFLGGISISQNLYLSSAITTIQDYFTFNLTTIDIISVPGTVVSQRGSSGGAVVDKNTNVIGIISTSSEGATTESRNLDAITSGYVSRTLQRETGLSLSRFLSQDLSQYAKSFNQNIAPRLTKLITDELNKQ